jgi:hypothetical protein
MEISLAISFKGKSFTYYRLRFEGKVFLHKKIGSEEDEEQ